MDSAPVDCPNGAFPGGHPGTDTQEISGGNIPEEVPPVVTDGKFECLPAVSQNNSEVPVADMGDTNQGSTPTYAGDNGDASSDMVEVGSPERLNHDSDDSDDELFVSQSPKIPRGAVIIDLTDEPEAVSAARAEAMKGVVYLTGHAPIKEEEDEERILPVAFKDDQGSPSSDGGDDHDSDSGRESEFELDTEGPLSDGEQPAKQLRRHPGNTNKKKPEQAHQRLQMSTDEELREMFDEHGRLEEKREHGPLSPSEKIKFHKLASKISRMERVAELMEKHGPKANQGGRSVVQQQANGTPSNEAQNRQAPRTSKQYWGQHYAKKKKEEQEDRKRKKTIRTNMQVMFAPESAIAARAAHGDVTLQGPIQATRNREAAIRAVKGPGAKRGDHIELTRAVQSFGKGQMQPDPGTGRWILKGMSSALYNHQVVGTSWMQSREHAPEAPYGGIVADHMGLGKTIQTIATMAANMPTQKDTEAGIRMTLIATLTPLIPQWTNEMIKHFSIIDARNIHHFRASRDVTPFWTNALFVLVTYAELARAYPPKKRVKALLKMVKEGAITQQEMDEEIEKECGVLLKTNWFRVVLDEGHVIRNMDSTTSKACLRLKARYRWILTGTPLHNGSQDFYAYMKFLRDPNAAVVWQLPVGDGTKRGEEQAYRKLNETVGRIMLRRKVDDSFLGKPILQIPRTHDTKIVYGRLSTEETVVCRRLQAIFVRSVRKLKKDGGSGKATRNVVCLAWLTLARRLIGHVFAAEGTLAEVFTPADFESLILRLARVGGKVPVFLQVKKYVQTEYERRLALEDGHVPSGKGAFGGIFNIIRNLEAMKTGEDLFETQCGMCEEMLQDRVTTQCGHSFCRDCLEGKLQYTERKCPVCDEVLPEESEADDTDDEDAATSLVQGRNTRRHKKKPARKTSKVRKYGEDVRHFQPRMKDKSTWVEDHDRAYERNPDAEMVPGAKTVIAKQIIQGWQAEAPDDKIVVFVQFVKTACVLGRILQQEDIDFVYYFGDLSSKEKVDTVIEFETNAKCKVMIASLACGGVGLNLTCANRAIIMDLWWNCALEDQAFGRIHRIGQQKETHFAKILTSGTVDDHLLAIQKRKNINITKTLEYTKLTDEEWEGLLMAGYEDGGQYDEIDDDDEE